jgi:CMP-N,N'-diacetyllegionaminic acid synthase
MSKQTTIAIIPARGGSKGIPGKNVRMVGGKPLLAHSIIAARGVVDAVYVSTDDEAIANVARRYGADVIDRPAALANDTATSESALVHALDVLRGREIEPETVVFLQATSPLRRPNDVANALAQFREDKADSLFSATDATGFMWRCGPEGPKPMNYDPVSRPRRQDAPRDVIENGSLYIFKPSVLRKYASRLGGKISVYMMRAEDSFQIDEPWELELLGWLFAREQQRTTSASGGTPHALGPAMSGYFTRREPTGNPNYESAYWGTIVDPDGKQRDRTAEREQHLSDLATELAFVRTLRPGRMLDVGCGLGFLLSGIPDGWEKHGVEVSAFAAERAGAYGTIHHGDLASAAYPTAHFDLVVMHHVIEHVDDPSSVLQEVLRVLKPGGKLILGTPDFDGAMARRFGENYRLLHDPTHVSLFSNDSMHRFLRDHALVIEHVDYPFFETRHFTPENLQRLFDTSQKSPAFYGSFMTFYCTKPIHADVRSSFIALRQMADIVATSLDQIIVDAGACLAECVTGGGKVLACGNGGSAADAQHFVAELVGRLKIERAPLPAISLSSDPSVVTCLANDYGYDELFARQVRAFGRPGDVLVAISTSGKSPNVLKAAHAARELGVRVVSLIGEKGDALAALSDYCIRIPTTTTQTIQELHMAVLHVLCAAIDDRIVENKQ